MPLLREISGNMCIAIACYTVCDVTDFVTLALLSSRILHEEKFRTKIKIAQERRELLR